MSLNLLDCQKSFHTVGGKTVTYEEMVKNLFKPMDGVGARMMHAAIGIAGESGELRTASGRAHVLEECGDLEFYIEAGWQELSAAGRMKMQGGLWPSGNAPTLGNVIDDIHVYGSALLDTAKKVWVYGGAKGDRDSRLAALLSGLELLMLALYSYTGTTRIEVMKLNMAKLLGTNETQGRYATGQYSDEQALARADKAEPASDRKFMSDASK